MTKLVDPTQIETIVGAPRHPMLHIGRAADGMLTIMHSAWCVRTGRDLRACPWSLALDVGRVDPIPEGQPIVLRMLGGRLAPEPIPADHTEHASNATTGTASRTGPQDTPAAPTHTPTASTSAAH